MSYLKSLLSALLTSFIDAISTKEKISACLAYSATNNIVQIYSGTTMTATLVYTPTEDGYLYLDASGNGTSSSFAFLHANQPNSGPLIYSDTYHRVGFVIPVFKGIQVRYRIVNTGSGNSSVSFCPLRYKD